MSPNEYNQRRWIWYKTSIETGALGPANRFNTYAQAASVRPQYVEQYSNDFIQDVAVPVINEINL